MNKCDYFGNPWIGMFIKTNDSVTLIPKDSLKKLEKRMEPLDTRIVKTSVGESNLLGIYVAMNNNGSILPNIATDEEVKGIKKLGMNAYRSESRHNANGNNIAVNDKGGIINPNVSSAERKKMEDVLGVELVPMRIGGYSTVGSSCIATNKGFLANYKATADELKRISSALKAKGERGTVNMGVGFVSFGVVVNSKNYVAGMNTTAFEMGRVVDALGLIE
jgi:translation initiation factor 6